MHRLNKLNNQRKGHFETSLEKHSFGEGSFSHLAINLEKIELLTIFFSTEDIFLLLLRFGFFAT
jgi:hypothetical protein